MSELTFDEIIKYKNIKCSYFKTQQGGKKYKKDSIIFGMAREKNLIEIWRELKYGRWNPSDYTMFKVYEPKERVIHAPKIKDKIVHFVAHKALQEIYFNKFIDSSYACLEGRGTHKAVDKVQHNMKCCVHKYNDGWIVKMDVAKFFYSINRNILKKILRKKVKDEKFLNLLDKIIDSSPGGEKGIPLGNVTSQDFANIYMNEVDQYAKRYLGLKYYVRYMDDIIIVVKTKDEAQKARDNIIKFLNDKLDLQTNDKTKIFPIRQGVNAYGFKIFTTHKLVRDSSKSAMKRRIKAMDKKIKSGKLDEKYVRQCVNSWLGHARHSNSYNLSKKIFSKYEYIDVENEKYKFGKIKEEYKWQMEI